MKFNAFLLSILVISAVRIAEADTREANTGSWGFNEEDNVIVLEQSTFDAALAKFDMILVHFYAPWCGHCKKLFPEWSKAAAELKKTDPAVPLAKVDATAHAELRERFGVKGYPTLKWFVNGQESEYNGGRTKQGIIDWVTKKSGKAISFNSQDALDGMKKDNKVVIAYFGAVGEEFQTFNTVAKPLDGVFFAHTENAKLVAAHGHKVVLFKQFDEGRNDFDGAMTPEALMEWIETNRFELVMPFEGEEANARIFQQENAAIVLFSDASGKHETIFADFAKANKGKIIFASSRTNEGPGQRLAEYVGVTSAPSVRLIHPSGGDLLKYDYAGGINAADLNEYLAKFQAGTLTRAYKSAAPPSGEQTTPVKVIVGSTFDEFITNSGKDVLLYGYAPWCGHCNMLTPKYEEAAKLLAHHSKELTLAMIDATENEIPGVQVGGFPTLNYWKAGKPDPIPYDGSRDTDGIVEWIKENASFEWKSKSHEEL